MNTVKTPSRKFVKATMKDVAKYAGVSVTTISHFINGRKFACSEETAERVNAAIKALHYAPGPSARLARDRATRTIGLCVESADDISETYDHRHTYHERLGRAIIREADEEAYALLHYPRCVRHNDSAEPFLDGRVDGMIFGAGRCDMRPDDLAAAGLPTVIVNRVFNIPDACGVVYINETDVVTLAMNYLWELGHRRIAHLAGPLVLPLDGYAGTQFLLPPMQSSDGNSIDVSPSDSATRRCEEYIRYMHERSCFDPQLIASIGSWADGSDVDVDALLTAWLSIPTPPTAIFCANDALAIAVTRAAVRCGVAIPNSLSVIGVNNQVAAAEANPPLTTVDIPAEILGREAMQLLLRMLSGGVIPYDQMKIAIPVTQLAVRSSTSAYHHAQAI